MPIAKRLIYGYVYMVACCTCLYYVFGYVVVFHFLGYLLLFFVGAYFLHYIGKTLFHREVSGFIEFFIFGIYKLSISLSVFMISFGCFCYYQNSISPAYLSLYTLTNGTKTVQFQTMSHIGRKDFYDSIKINIGKAKKQGFVLFYEGVRPGSEKNMKTFEELLGVQFGSDFYSKYASFYGLSTQNNDDFLNIKNKKDFNVDLDIDSIIELYIEKTLSEAQKSQYEKDVKLGRGEKLSYNIGIQKPEKIDSSLFDNIPQNEHILSFTRYINTALLNWIIKQESLQKFILEKTGKQNIFDIILGERNAHLALEIQKSKFQNIFVLYGMLHFQGVFEILKTQDGNWKIKETKDFYPITEKNIPGY